MLDIKWIRENAEKFNQHLKNRGLSSQAERLITLDERRRKSIDRAQSIQSERKKKSGEVAGAKKDQNDVLAEQLIEEVSQLKEAHKQADDKAKQLSAELDHALSEQPNLPLDDVPIGSDENDNVEIRRRGQRPAFDFSPKEHFQIGEDLGLMDFKSAAQMSGARFVLLRGNLARLERALGQFMLDMHVNEHGYQEIAPPLLVRDEAMYGTGQLPKFKEDLFKAGDSHWLIPTAEVSLTNLAAQNIWSQNDLPMRFSALTACFRSEAGSAGRDVRGMLRQHQFMKCELVSVTSQDASAAELERMLKSAEAVLKALKLPYRVITLCTGDMGPQARKTYDIEVWLPGQNRYREISSCSICGDYQARRMNARYRDENGKLNFVHTLNGSGVASGRALIAVLENCQNADGSVTVPEALRPYMGGLDVISKPC